uniref:Glycine-rich domain-containing protein n=1 Tax=viral metagenome TaxID=1070528 RepID=A0A6C0DTL9_9ZZZZ
MSNNLNLLTTSGGKRWNMWNIKKIQSAPGNKLVISGNLSNSVLNLGNNIDVSGNIYMNGNFKIPVNTTANRPGPNNYYMQYNTTTGNFEYNNGSTWQNILTTGSTLANLTISGIANTGPFYLYPNLTTSATPVVGGTTYYSITGTTSYSRTSSTLNSTGAAAVGGSGTIVPNFSGPAYYIIVGGGGGGGNGTTLPLCCGGGGGGGGVVTGNAIVANGSSYPVIVGAGGNTYNSYNVANPGTAKIANNGQDGGPGGYSMVFGIVAAGGAGGRGTSSYTANIYYSWGGSSGFPQKNSGGTNQVFNSSLAQGGGGAGAQVGYTFSANGANGLTINTGVNYSISVSAYPSGNTILTSNTFGGGGGGGGASSYGTGGTGGGGSGSQSPSIFNQDGTCGLGGGGGGKKGADNWYPGVGGSGLVIISFNTYV